MSALDKFDGIAADFWACNDPDRLTHEDPISALEEWIDSHLSRDCDVEAIIREMGEISVEAYSRVAIRETDIDSALDRAIEAVEQHFDEDSDYHDPDGDHQIFSVDVLAKHRPAFEAAVRALVADAIVWHCESTTVVTLTPDETLEIMRVECPEWFEKEEA